MNVPWAIICLASAVDQETNRVSLFNIMEEIQVPAPPAVAGSDLFLPGAPVDFELFILFARDAPTVCEQGRGRVWIQFPQGKTPEPPPENVPEFPIDLTAACRHRVRVGFPALPVKSEGTYRFIIEAATEVGAWRRLFDVPLEVSYQVRDSP